MQKQFYMEIIGSLSDKGFSLDELVVKVKELFEAKGMPGLIELILSLVDEQLCLELVQGRVSEGRRLCCPEPRYEYLDRRPRRFRMTAGDVHISWRRLRCRRCGKAVTPLREFLGLKPHESKTAQLEQMVAEVVSEQSYRRTSRHLDVIGHIPVPKSTAHRWVMQSDCDEIRVEGKMVDTLFADGTGYKRRPDKDSGQNNRGELRVVVGVNNNGDVVPFGSWSGQSWDSIGRQIRKHTLPYGAQTGDAAEPPEPIAKIFINDGEPGMSEALAHLAEGEQRCHWHAIDRLDYILWEDAVAVAERRRIQKQLAGLIGIELPAEDFQHVSPQHKAELERSTHDAECQLDQLIGELAAKGYSHAASYVRKARDRLFTYIRFWLKYGLVSPRASSMIERMMREIGRRLKKIAFGWSEAGAAKIARIIIKRITTAGEWQDYWKQRLRIEDKIVFTYRGVTAH